MDIVFLGIVISLFVYTVLDLFVEVNNYAFNFLNSDFDTKAATFKTILKS